MNARVREVICLAGVGICLLAAIPFWAFDSEQLREQVGFTVNIEVTEPGSLPASEGKARRVIDERG